MKKKELLITALGVLMALLIILPVSFLLAAAFGWFE